MKSAVTIPVSHVITGSSVHTGMQLLVQMEPSRLPGIYTGVQAPPSLREQLFADLDPEQRICFFAIVPLSQLLLPVLLKSGVRYSRHHLYQLQLRQDRGRWRLYAGELLPAGKKEERRLLPDALPWQLMEKREPAKTIPVFIRKKTSGSGETAPAEEPGQMLASVAAEPVRVPKVLHINFTNSSPAKAFSYDGKSPRELQTLFQCWQLADKLGFKEKGEEALGRWMAQLNLQTVPQDLLDRFTECLFILGLEVNVEYLLPEEQDKPVISVSGEPLVSNGSIPIAPVTEWEVSTEVDETISSDPLFIFPESLTALPEVEAASGLLPENAGQEEETASSIQLINSVPAIAEDPDFILPAELPFTEDNSSGPSAVIAGLSMAEAGLLSPPAGAPTDLNKTDFDTAVHGFSSCAEEQIPENPVWTSPALEAEEPFCVSTKAIEFPEKAMPPSGVEAFQIVPEATHLFQMPEESMAASGQADTAGMPEPEEIIAPLLIHPNGASVSIFPDTEDIAASEDDLEKNYGILTASSEVPIIHFGLDLALTSNEPTENAQSHPEDFLDTEISSSPLTDGIADVEAESETGFAIPGMEQPADIIGGDPQLEVALDKPGETGVQREMDKAEPFQEKEGTGIIMEKEVLTLPEESVPQENSDKEFSQLPGGRNGDSVSEHYPAEKTLVAESGTQVAAGVSVNPPAPETDATGHRPRIKILKVSPYGPDTFYKNGKSPSEVHAIHKIMMMMAHTVGVGVFMPSHYKLTRLNDYVLSDADLRMLLQNLTILGYEYTVEN